MIFMTPSSLVALMCLGPGIEPKRFYLSGGPGDVGRACAESF